MLKLISKCLVPIVFATLLAASVGMPSCAYAQGDREPFKSAVELRELSSRYNIAGHRYSTQFFIPPGDMTLQEFANGAIWQTMQVTTTNDLDYEVSQRYWFGIDIINRSEEQRWMLHISNFHIHRIKVLYNDGEVLVSQLSNLSQGRNNIPLNPLGRGFPLTLKKDKKYRLVVELNSNIDLHRPYFGLMTNNHYQQWSTYLRYAHILPLGVIFGLSFIGIICFFWFKTPVFFWFSLSSVLLISFNALQSSMLYDLFSIPYALYWWIRAQFFLLAISLYLFAFEFLQVKHNQGFLRKSFYYLIGLVILTYLLSFFVSPLTMTYVLSFNAVVFIIHITLVGLYKVRKEGGYYLIYMLGWVPIIFFLIDYLLMVMASKNTQGEIEASYTAIREVYFQVLHILIHGIAVIVQITSLKRDKETAEQTSLAKSWLMAANSHDLRQPLNTMSLYLSLLKDETNPEQHKKIVSNLSKAQEVMSDSFQSLMELSQLEAGTVDVNIQATEIQALLQNLEALYEGIAKAKGLEFKIRVKTNTVYVDTVLLKRILSNLISNAIKYTEKGGVLVVCRRKTSKLLIQVWDTGNGIAANELPLIFDIYSRANSSKNLNSGMGIGLAIVKKLADLMHCKLRVRSKLGKGSMFSIELPLLEREQ